VYKPADFLCHLGGRGNPVAYGSLIFGGYDTSRWNGTNIEFPFAVDSEQPIAVRVKSISLHSIQYNGIGTGQVVEDLKLNFGDNGVRSPNPSGYISRIDSSRPYLYLPQSACDEIEAKLGLTWDKTSKHYLISNDTHAQLQQRNPMLVFELAQITSILPKVETQTITLPYSALALQLSFPHLAIGNSSLYFPMMPTNDTDKFLLGRVFLQEAYLIANYERQAFSLSQVTWDKIKVPATVDTILPGLGTVQSYIKYGNGTLHPSGSSHQKISRAALIGTIVGCVILSFAIFCFCFFLIRRSKVRILIQRTNDDEANSAPASATANLADSPSTGSTTIGSELASSPGSLGSMLNGNIFEADGTGITITELDASKQILEMPDSARPKTLELDSTDREIFEMGGSPVTTEDSINEKGQAALVRPTLEPPPPPAYSSTIPASPIPQTPREYYGRHANLRFGFSHQDISRSHDLGTIISESDSASSTTTTTTTTTPNPSRSPVPASAIPQTPAEYYGGHLPEWRKERDRRAAATATPPAAQPHLDEKASHPLHPLQAPPPPPPPPPSLQVKHGLEIPQSDMPRSPASPIPQTPLEFYGALPPALASADQRRWVGRAPEVPNINLIPATPDESVPPSVPFRSARRDVERRPPIVEKGKSGEGGGKRG
jgi:hypothetical protein